ncbi:MAG: DUF1674 domain-containing protein [Rhodospirillaceae bacterium]|nr:DUF1674 domain-containing protein [Rhodospirillaceae bacterium]
MSNPNDKPAEKPAENPGIPPRKPATAPDAAKLPPKEFGGPTGPEPTRYGDWERNGKVSDF